MTQRNVIIYYRPTCPYCRKALELLESKPTLNITKLNINEHPELREEMINKSGRTTVPQIFIDGEHIGGCDDLMFKYNSGSLPL